MKNKILANNYDQAAKELETIEKGLSAKISNEIDEGNNGHFTVALVRSTNNEIMQKYEHKVSIQQLNSRAFEKMANNLAVTGYDKMIIVHNPDPNHKRNTKVVAFTPGSNQSNANNKPIETPEQIEARVRAEFEKKYEGFTPAPEKIDLPLGGQQLETPEQIENRLRAEFEHRFGPDTKPEVEKTEDFISLSQDGAKLKIFFANPNAIFDSADETDVVMVGDFNDRSSVADLEKFAKDNEIDLSGVTGKANILTVLKTWKSENVK